METQKNCCQTRRHICGEVTCACHLPLSVRMTDADHNTPCQNKQTVHQGRQPIKTGYRLRTGQQVYGETIQQTAKTQRGTSSDTSKNRTFCNIFFCLSDFSFCVVHLPEHKAPKTQRLQYVTHTRMRQKCKSNTMPLCIAPKGQTWPHVSAMQLRRGTQQVPGNGHDDSCLQVRTA